MRAEPVQVTVVILCRNEATNLPRCIAPFRSFCPVVVLDDRSEDGSREVAVSHGARVISNVFRSFADQRNIAMNDPAITTDWVLHLDADEVLEDRGLGELRERLPSLRTHQIGFFARKVMLGDRWLRYSADYPVFVPRLIHRNGPRFIMRGHGEWIDAPDQCAVYFSEPFLHFNFSHGWDDWWARHRRYATAEATRIVESLPTGAMADLFSGDRTRRRAVLRAWSYRLPARPFLRLVYSYLLRGGFRDGRAGWTFAQAMAGYERLIDREVKRIRADTSCASS